MSAPASTKMRRTKVALAWFFDPHRRKWRFAPQDTTHNAQRETRDRITGTTEHVRTIEAKGWVPASVALSTIPDAKKALTPELRELFGVSEPAKAS